MVQRLIEESRHKRTKHREEIVRNNQDLKERVAAEGVEIDYLPEDDYLRIIIGAPAESISITYRDPLYFSLMVDPETHKVNALEVPGFMASLKKMKPSPARDFWTVIAEIVSEREGVSVYFPSRQTREKAERALLDLAF